VANGEESGQERTEEPTEKKKEDAREKGQVPHSRETSNVVIFLAGLGIVYLLKDAIVGSLTDCMAHFFSFDRYVEMSMSDARLALRAGAGFVLRTVGPILAVVFVAAAGSNVLQFGFLYSPQRIEPNFNRLNAVEGFRRIFSLRQGLEGLKGALKILIVGVVVFLVFRSEMARIETMSDETPRGLLDHIVRTGLLLMWKVSIFLIALAVFDFAYQRWEHNRSLRMTRQELKDEFKEREGDPLVKQRIRQIRRERARRRMMAEVPEADVVVTNPSHVAVALRYERREMKAPRVVAKGAGYIAERIRAIAREHGVPLVENKPVARLLYKTVKVGQEIPVSLYKAIAGILAYVYKTAKRKPKWS
jgi:flagellar biosynthetic protein FlhB